MAKLAKQFSLNFCDISNLSPDTYTYISENSSCSTSWIDHILSSDEDMLSEIEVLYGDTFSDHIPIKFKLRMPANCQVSPVRLPPKSQDPLVAWSKATNVNINNYSFVLDTLVGDFLNDAIICHDEKCENISHKKNIENLYEILKKCILEASDSALPSISKNGNFKIVPGWNDNCKDLYHQAKDHFLLWNSLGKIRCGIIFEAMKDSRAAFKRALNYCKANELQIRKQKIVESHNHGEKSLFWKNVRAFTPKSNSWIIDGTSDPKEITDIFNEKYKNILDNKDCHSNDGTSYCNRAPNNNDHLCNIYFCENPLKDAIDKLNTGLGFDGIHSNHLKLAGPVFKNLLSRFYSACLRHCYLPHDMIMGVIKPTLKGTACKTKSESFRPVMNSSIFMKILEYCLMPTLKQLLSIDPLQFGFQTGSNCDYAIALLKETVLNYKNEATNVHAAALDLSKAYDRVNHDLLLRKLCKAGVPKNILKILQYLFSNTYDCVKINGMLGQPFKVRNGVRQGGCLSSLLFAFYINEVLVSIKNMKMGCRLNFEQVNIIAFADDLVILSSSLNNLRIMLENTYMLFFRNISFN